MAGPFYVDGSVGNDANAGTSEGSGNAWATVQKAADTAVAGEIVYVKSSADYAEDVDFDTNTGTPGNRITFIGYTSTITDGGKATITGSNSRAHCISLNGTADYVTMRNFIFTSPTSHCADVGGITDGWIFNNCHFTKGSGTSPASAIDGSSTFRYVSLYRCLLKDFSGNAIDSSIAVNLLCDSCVIKDNGGIGIATGTYRDQLTIRRCVIAGNTGDGITLGAATYLHCFDSIFEGNGGDGIDIGGGNHKNIVITGCIFANHSGTGDTGLKAGSLTGNSSILCDYNAFYNNTTHKSGSGTTGLNDITLSADPFVNAASDDWNINNDSGGGADLRAATLTMPV